MEPVSFFVTHVEDAHPQIIHIYNLDDGPRAIVLPRYNPRTPIHPSPFEFSTHREKAFRKSSSRRNSHHSFRRNRRAFFISSRNRNSATSKPHNQGQQLVNHEEALAKRIEAEGALKQGFAKMIWKRG